MAKAGHYYEKQLLCDSKVIAWSHAARFDTARALLGSGRLERVLDYGCGDATFLASLDGQIREGVGADVDEKQLEDCRERLAEMTQLTFCLTDELIGPEHDGRYDAVTCMETLEHCTERVVDRVLADLNRLCAPGGRIVISVPIETGVPFLIKSTLRRAAAWRGLSDYLYYERYSFRNGLRMIVAGKTTAIDRPQYGTPGREGHSHYGFNWRRMRARVAEVLTLERTEFSPLGWLKGAVSSQAWFVCRPRA